MIKEFKNSFMQTSFITTVWSVLLATIFLPNQLIDVTYGFGGLAPYSLPLFQFVHAYIIAIV